MFPRATLRAISYLFGVRSSFELVPAFSPGTQNGFERLDAVSSPISFITVQLVLGVIILRPREGWTVQAGEGAGGIRAADGVIPPRGPARTSRGGRSLRGPRTPE